MKVASLLIHDYNQFKDFSLDLTYPLGHPKAGKPLDKICIIGQSGTGKTTLLKFIQNFTKIRTEKIKLPNNGETERIKYDNSAAVFNFRKVKFDILIDDLSYKIELIDDTINIHSNGRGKEISSKLNKIKHKNIFINAEQNADFSDFEKKPYLEKKDSQIEFWQEFAEINPKHFISYWSLLVDEVKEFQKTIINKRNDFAKLAIDKFVTPSTIEKEAKKLREWEENQINPLKNLGENCLDKILNDFHLKIKTEVDFEDIGFIKLETLDGKEVAGDLLSTGSKQILLTALPLYSLKPENSIILFDEPERSLYPDIQTKIIDFYTSLGKDCQFFFATHSPIIASCFEPWEIVELKFNEDGSVYREPYFKGENHVDNYFINPQYLRWDSILTKVFDLDTDSNPKRIEKLMELAKIRSKIKKLNGSATLEEKQTLMKEFEKLANLLDCEFDEKD